MPIATGVDDKCLNDIQLVCLCKSTLESSFAFFSHSIYRSGFVFYLFLWISHWASHEFKNQNCNELKRSVCVACVLQSLLDSLTSRSMRWELDKEREKKYSVTDLRECLFDQISTHKNKDHKLRHRREQYQRDRPSSVTRGSQEERSVRLILQESGDVSPAVSS
jgi:hypothetical protein